MSLAVATVLEVRTAGTDTNGGGFVTGASGTDFSQQNSKNTATGSDDSTTDAVANGSTTLTSATANFTAAIVGNIIYLQGGTGGLGASWYQVASRTNSTTIVLDRTVATGTGITMNVGGALASPGMAAKIVSDYGLSGNKIWIKSGTYTITSAATNDANRCMDLTSRHCVIQGYDATRGDITTKPLLQASGITSFTLISITNQTLVRNLSLNGISASSSRGISGSGTVADCHAANFTNAAYNNNNSADALVCLNCSATGCSSVAVFNGPTCVNCTAYSNTFTGFLDGFNANCVFVRCLSINNSGALTRGFEGNNNAEKSAFINCVAYNNGQDGFLLSQSNGAIVVNCIAENNTRYGFNATNVSSVLLQNCAGYNNTTANVSLGTGMGCVSDNFVTGSGSFFTNAAGGDFTLNNTAGGGADAREAGMPGTMPGNASVGYLDIGVFQTQGGGGGGASEHSSVF